MQIVAMTGLSYPTVKQTLQGTRAAAPPSDLSSEAESLASIGY